MLPVLGAAFFEDWMLHLDTFKKAYHCRRLDFRLSARLNWFDPVNLFFKSMLSTFDGLVTFMSFMVAG